MATLLVLCLISLPRASHAGDQAGGVTNDIVSVQPALPGMSSPRFVLLDLISPDLLSVGLALSLLVTGSLLILALGLAGQLGRIASRTARMRAEAGMGSSVDSGADKAAVPAGTADGIEADLDQIAARLKEVVSARDELKALSVTDPLTGLTNRRGLEDQLEVWLGGEDALPVLTAMHVDLDHFKVVNDTLGHDAGDHVLVVVARRLATAVRADDIVSRVGGDEFVILLPGLDDLGQLAQIAMRIIRLLSEPITHDGRTAQIGGSVGIALGGVMNGIEDAEDLLKGADLAAFKSKAGGRNRFSVFDQRMRSYIEHQRSMAERLTAALDADHIEAWLQPVLDPTGKKLISVEALARWHDPNLGIVSAEDFIEIATQRNLITNIGTVVIARASTAIARWSRRGFDIPQVSFNLSDQELKSAEIVDQIKWALERAELSPDKVAVELDADLGGQRGAEMVTQHTDQLRALGVSVIIDDVDLDRPSVSMLERLGVGVVKFDRKVTDSLLDDDAQVLRLQRHLDLFRSMEIEVIGKGVNNAELSERLQDIGCIGMQGLFFAPPMSFSQFEDWMIMRQEADHADDAPRLSTGPTA